MDPQYVLVQTFDSCPDNSEVFLHNISCLALKGNSGSMDERNHPTSWREASSVRSSALLSADLGSTDSICQICAPDKHVSLQLQNSGYASLTGTE